VALFFGRLEVGDVAFFFQDAGNLRLELGGGDIDFLVPRVQRIAQPRQHICDRIGQPHRLLLLELPSVCRGGGAFIARRGTRNGSVSRAPDFCAAGPAIFPALKLLFQNHQNIYQDDFMTPGISPLSASERKHKRQMPNLRKNARGRPHRLQRLCWRLENFGFFLSFTRFAVVAILLPIVTSMERCL
jgi:hypothetical protein